MKKILGTVFASLGIAGLMLYALTSNTTLMENSTTRVLSEDYPFDEQLVKQFNDFASLYHRSYLTKAEYQARLQAFKTNYDTI